MLRVLGWSLVVLAVLAGGLWAVGRFSDLDEALLAGARGYLCHCDAQPGMGVQGAERP